MSETNYRRITPFLAVLLLYQLILAVFLYGYGYRGSFILLNALHLDWLDAPMFLLTHMGDALILTSLLGLIFIRKDPALVLMLIVVVIATGLAGQLMKNFLFDSWDRPLSVFGANEVHTVYGYLLFQNSFPSGHSITVAAAVTTVAMAVKPGKMMMIFLALTTALISYTRVYVGAHFAADVLAGTIFGASGSIFLTAWYYPRIRQWISARSLNYLNRLKTSLVIVAIAGLISGVVMISEYLKQMF